MSAQGQDPPSPGTPGEASQQPLSGEDVLNRLAVAVSQLAAASSGARPSEGSWKETKYVKAPDLFAPKSLEEEVQAWGDWSFQFRNFMAIQDAKYRDELQQCEVADGFLSFSSFNEATRERALRLYSVLASYLRGRPLKILKSVTTGNGYQVWRQLCDELQPRSRPRALALAQALTRFPPLKEGHSLLDYILSYERLVNDYEEVSPQQYPEDLKISTLLSGLPSDMRRYLQMQVTDATTYQALRDKVLQFERSSSTWTSEQMLKALGIDKVMGGSENTAMEVDRVEGKGRGGGKKGDGKYFRKGENKGRKGDGKVPRKGEQKGKKGDGKQGKKGFVKQWTKPGKGFSKKDGPQQKASGACFICGKFGHYAADCYQRAQQVQVPSEESSTILPSSSSSVVSGASSSATSVTRQNVRRVFEVDLRTLGEDEDGFMDENFRIFRVEDDAEENSSEEELCSRSVLHYDLAEEDDGLMIDLPTQSFVRAVARQDESDEASYQEVILDSGADCTVLPFGMFADVGAAGGTGPSLRDAQGNEIPQSSGRVGVKFQVTGCDGEQIVFLDNVVLAAVKQPLVCLGKLLKGNWALGSKSDGMVLERAGMAFPVHWSKNSLAAFMKIYKITEDEAQSSGTAVPEASVRLIVEVSEELQTHLEAPGWSLNVDMRPVHFALKESETVDPSLKFNPEEWPYRTTLLRRGNRRYELFECGEEWNMRRRIPFGSEECVGTMLSRTPLDPEEVGKPVSGTGYVKVLDPVSNQALGELAGEPETPEPAPQERGDVRPLGPLPVEAHEHEEAVEVNGVKLTEESSLKDLRTACKYLRISKNGAKSLVWARLKKEVAMLRLKTSVECSDAVKAEFEREPIPQALPIKPSPEVVALHEITHILV